MKIIEPSVGLWKQGDDVKAHVAKCARVCYGKETGNDDVTIDYNRGKIFHIDGPINTQNEDIPNILEEYGLKESECNYIVTEYPCKIINLTYEDKIVSKENKTQDNKVFI